MVITRRRSTRDVPYTPSGWKNLLLGIASKEQVLRFAQDDKQAGGGFDVLYTAVVTIAGEGIERGECSRIGVSACWNLCLESDGGGGGAFRIANLGRG